MPPRVLALASILAVTVPSPAETGPPVLTPRTSLAAAGIGDQDDMCVWIHPRDPAASTIITSDKDVERLFVYDLAGETIQSIPVPGKPGNIDVRYGFPLEGGPVDIVAYNDRDRRKVMVFAVDPSSRRLSRVDDDTIDTGSNYGLCLYANPASGRFHAFVTAESGAIEQYELGADAGRVTGTLVRSWSFGGQTEGCVCDDEAALAFFGEEDRGIWRVSGEPLASTEAVLVAAVGDASGLRADVEGLTLYYAGQGGGYLLASGQSIGTFFVWERRPPHSFVKSFTVLGVDDTDGIDVTNVALGPRFPAGVFAAHDGSGSPHTVEVCGWEDAGLLVDTTSWDPRRPPATPVRASSWGRMKGAYRDRAAPLPSTR